MKRLCKILAATLVISNFTMVNVFAEPLSDKLNTQKSMLKNNENSLTDIQAKRDKIEQELEKLDVKIEDSIDKIDENKKIIKIKNAEVIKLGVELQSTQKNIDNDQVLYGKRIRLMYEEGNAKYIELILSSSSFSDFISKTALIQKIAELDKKIINGLKSKYKDVKNKKEAIVDETTKLNNLVAINEQELKVIKGSKDTQNNLLAELKTKEYAILSQSDTLKASINSTLKQISDANKAATPQPVSRGSSSLASNPGVANAVIAYASTFLGVKYLWGGTLPSTGFDCSGLTQYVLKNYGVNVGRTTYDQINDGVQVSKSDLKPGDLVFYGTSGPTHMGMYIGNGLYIHAPRTGDVVKISSYERNDYITARRVIN